MRKISLVLVAVILFVLSGCDATPEALDHMSYTVYDSDYIDENYYTQSGIWFKVNCH